MNPVSGFRQIIFDQNVIFEKKQKTHYTRLCLPNLEQGTVQFLNQFGDFYQCNLTLESFQHQSLFFKNEALKLIKQNINGTCKVTPYLHRKIKLAHVGLTEDWHSPVFFVKINNEIIATTGHNKIYATLLRKKNLNLDFKCFVIDIDRDKEHFFEQCVTVINDQHFSDLIKHNNFAFDLSFEKHNNGFIPAIMQFSNEYPIQYRSNNDELAKFNQGFFRENLVNGKLVINIHDRYQSDFSDSSGIFKINYKNNYTFTHSDQIRKQPLIHSNELNLVTAKSIKLDLSDLLIFFDQRFNIYNSANGSFIIWHSKFDYNEKFTCPADLKIG